MIPGKRQFMYSSRSSVAREGALQGSRVGLSTRRLRLVADREHDGGTPGALHRRTAARGPAYHVRLYSRGAADRGGGELRAIGDVGMAIRYQKRLRSFGVIRP